MGEVGGIGLKGLGLSWVLLCTGIVVGAYRWRILTLAYGGKDVPHVPTLTRNILVGAYFNMLPGGIAGEGVRAIRMRPHLSDVVTSVNVLVVERVVGLVGLLLLASVAASWLPHGDHTVLVRSFEAGVVFALLLATCAIILPYLIARVPELRSAILKVPLGGALLLKVPPAHRPFLIAGAVLLSLLTQGLAIASIFTVTRGLSPDAPTAIVGALPLIILVTHVPLAPGGIGQREAAFVYFYGLVGVSATLAIGTSVIVFLIFVSFAALGGICYFSEAALSGRAAR